MASGARSVEVRVGTFAHGWWVVLGLAGCFGGGAEPSPAGPELVHPLDKATVAPWRQQVWFVADPGESVEALTLSEGAQPHLVVTLGKQDGTKRAVRLEGPGLAVPEQYTPRDDARSTRSVSSADGALRASVSTGDATSLVVTDTRAGGRSVVVRDVPERDILHPSLDVEGRAVYFGEGRDLGGLYRAALPEGTVTRIVPEAAASTAVAFPDGRDERIAYIEEGGRPKVLVAWPEDERPRRPAAEAHAEGRLPLELVPVVVAPDGSPVRLHRCEPEPSLVLKQAADGVIGIPTVDAARFGLSLYCGRTCTELLTASPDHASRVAARVEQDPDTQVWHTWFDPTFSLAHDTWVTPERAASVPIVEACYPARDPSLWLVEPRMTLPQGERVTHLAHSGDLLSGMGMGSNYRFIVTLHPRAKPFGQRVLRERNPPDQIARTADGGATAAAQDGGIVWTEVATGATSVVLDPDPARDLRDPAFDGGGSVLYVVDRGERPGLLRISLDQGTMSRVVALTDLERPLPIYWDGAQRVAMVRNTADSSTVLTARPLTDGEAAAWDTGPLTLLGVVEDWTPVVRIADNLVRCEAPDRIQLGIDSEGGFLRWGDVRASARAVVVEGDAVRVLDEVDGAPTVVAELRLDVDPPLWFPRSLKVKPTAVGWMPTADVASLPLEGACPKP